jgi:hypothetical protein
VACCLSTWNTSEDSTAASAYKQVSRAYQWARRRARGDTNAPFACIQRNADRSLCEAVKYKVLLITGALLVSALAFAGDYFFRAITLAPLAGISVVAITIATNVRVGLAAAVVVGGAFSLVDAIEPNGRLIDAVTFAVGYAVTAVLVDATRRVAARGAILAQEHIAATAAHNHLLPAYLPDLNSWHIKVIHVPLGDLGGDFYDIRKRGDDLGLLVCDVSGKGLKAAMLLGAVKVLFQEMPLIAVGKRLKRMNEAFMPVCEDGMFCTAWYGHFESDGTVRFSLAGHEPGYRRSDGVITTLPHGGLPLGVAQATTFEEYEVHLAENDMLLLHTDGISELLANNSITVEDLFEDRPGLEDRIRASHRRDDALLVIVTRGAPVPRAVVEMIA